MNHQEIQNIVASVMAEINKTTTISGSGNTITEEFVYFTVGQPSECPGTGKSCSL